MALVGVTAALAMIAPPAGAVVVQEPNGQRAGLALVHGVDPASVPGSQVRRGVASAFAAAGNLNYNGGPVLHGITPYLIFWGPSGRISAADEALYARFFSDSAADSGKATNIWAVDRQFTDSTGFANYAQTWNSTHAIVDTHPYPAKSSQCTEASYAGETACLYDSQIQAEVARLKTADALPSGLTGSAPIYFVVTPQTVNSCFSDNSTCGDNAYCAYHSSFTASGKTLLYADMPTLLAVQDPKGCQADGNSAVQHPNARPAADVVLKAMSHEASETITDPLGNAWFNSNSGNEDGDQCNFAGSFSPDNGTNPNAFKPYLGGSATAGTLYNQLIHFDRYYIQSEWSNGDVNCKMQPTAATLTAAFTAPASAAHGTPVSFKPAGSSSAAGYTSTTWSFGSAQAFSRTGPTTVSHTFPKAGTFSVTLTVVDKYGNLKAVSHTITVS